MADSNDRPPPSAHDRRAPAQDEVSASRESEERFRLLVENSQDILFRFHWKPSFGFDYVSPAATRITGYTPDEHYADPYLIFRLVHPADLLAFDRFIRSAPHDPLPLTTRWVRKDGRVIWVEQHVSRVYDVAGEAVAVEGTVRDITERRRAEAEQERLAALVESSEDAIIGKTLDDTIVSWNSGAERLYGYSAQEAIGKPSSIIIPTDQVEQRSDILERIKRGERIQHHEAVRKKKDGSHVAVSLSASPIRDTDGQIIGASTIAHDITDLKQLEREREVLLSQLRERAEKLEDLLRSISHDLRSPLTVIQGYAQMLSRFENKPDQLRASAAAILVSAKRLDSMIQDLVDSTRLETGRLELDRQPVELGGLLGDLKSRLRGTMPVERLRLDCPAHPVLVSADKDRVERVLMNLLGNALKYSPLDTEVVIRVQAGTDAGTVISVVDHGPGIPIDDLPRLFERFYRSSRTKSIEGLGLGLYIARGLVEAHGGRIWVESREGGGTSFHFTLPPAQANDG